MDAQDETQSEYVHLVWPEEIWNRSNQATYIVVDGIRIDALTVSAGSFTDSQAIQCDIEVHIGIIGLLHELEQIDEILAAAELAPYLLDQHQLGPLNTRAFLLDIVHRHVRPQPKGFLRGLVTVPPKPTLKDWIWCDMNEVEIVEDVAVLIKGKCIKAP